MSDNSSSTARRMRAYRARQRLGLAIVPVAVDLGLAVDGLVAAGLMEEPVAGDPRPSLPPSRHTSSVRSEHTNKMLRITRIRKIVCQFFGMSAAIRAKSPPPTAADLAARVPKSPALILAERNLCRLRDLRDEVDAQREVVYRIPPSRVGRLAWEIDAKKRRVEADLTSARKEATALRTAHENAVRAALDPLRADAVAQFARAYGDLIAAWQILDAVEAEINKVAVQSAPTRMKAAQFEYVFKTFQGVAA